MIFKNTNQLQSGSIVWVSVSPPRGERKLRPLVVITRDEEIVLDAKIVGVAITSTFEQPAPDRMVELPWSARGHPVTRLSRRSAAVCDWLVTFRPSDVTQIKGYVPLARLLAIREKVSELADE